MPLLILDTAIHQCACAVRLDDGRVISRAERLDKGHAERLPDMVAEAMAEAEIVFSDLTQLACGIGPGSFTGIRVALSLARGYSLALGLPVIGVTTLEAMAAPFLGKQVLAAISAGRGEVYTQAFDAQGIPTCPAQCVTIDQIGELLPVGVGCSVGSGAEGLQLEGWAYTGHDLPDIAAAANIAARRAPEVGSLSPLYLRPPDAKPSTYRLERANDFFV